MLTICLRLRVVTYKMFKESERERVTKVIKKILKSQAKIEYKHSTGQNVFLVQLD